MLTSYVKLVEHTRILYKKAAANQQLLLFLVLWSTPLFFIKDNMLHTRMLHLMMLLFLGGWVLASDELRGTFLQNLSKLSSKARLILGGIVLFMFISTLLSGEQVGLRLVGLAPEYIGFFTWMTFLIVGITLANSFAERLLSRSTLLLTTVILLIGLVYNKFYIYYGLRVSGLLFQSTTMSMYAVLCLALGLYSLGNRGNRGKLGRGLSLTCIVLSTATLILTQSRIGYIAFVLVLFAWGIHRLKNKWLGTLVVVVTMIVLSSLPYLFGSYFARFRTSNIERGVSYRMDLYEVSVKDVVNNNLLIGNGSGSLPPGINNKDAVPEEIARTLEQDMAFISTHDMYLDFAHQFGLLASLGVVLLTAAAFYKNIRAKEYGFLLIIFGITILNALFNVPSIEFTPLYFLVLFALIVPKPLSETKKHRT